jgi:signal transduction histidine kinase
LKELEAVKRDFIAGVTHDFGTPLHAIKNALEYLQEKKAGPINGKQAEYLLMISNNTHQLTAFINNLLTTARIEAAKVDPFYEPVDALALTREVVDLYKPQAEKKGIQLELSNEEPSLSMVTDVTMFRQILTNLVSNAMKYTPEGNVTLNLSKRDGFTTLKVSDTGIGIAPEHQTLIFDKFFRVRQPKSFPVAQGTGLGLSITKGLAEAMGGTVLVKSEPGKGTTFTVKLPRRASAAAEIKGA